MHCLSLTALARSEGRLHSGVLPGGHRYAKRTGMRMAMDGASITFTGAVDGRPEVMRDAQASSRRCTCAVGRAERSGKRLEYRCAGSNNPIAGPSLVRPHCQVRFQFQGRPHCQVRSHSQGRPHCQVRPQRLGCCSSCRLRHQPARNQVAHRCAVCERNRHARPAASPAGARTEMKRLCRTLHPACPGPWRDLQSYPRNRVPQQ